MNDDAALLRRYAEEGSETAFGELVRRHLDLVYGAALRRLGGDAAGAADVAQQVFSTLARQARRLAGHAVLSAWLHTATRNAALNLMISEQRRKLREHAAQETLLATQSTAPEWERLRPVLDAAIDELAETDRAAVVLRFLEQRPFAEIGAALHLSADAARMRTDRALEKLRAALGRRGITSTAAAMSALLSSQPILAAPAGLASVITTTAFCTASTGTGLLTLLTASLMKFKTIAFGGGALFAFAAGTYVGLSQRPEDPVPVAVDTSRVSRLVADLRKENGAMRTEIEQLKANQSRTTAARPTPPGATPVPAATPPASDDARQVALVMKQRAIINNLRMLGAAADQFELEHKRPPLSVQELVGPDKYVRSLTPVDGEDYSALVFGGRRALAVTSPTGVAVTYDPNGTLTTRAEMPPLPPHLVAHMQRLAPSIQRALAAYQATHGGSNPANSAEGATALLPYFATPQEGADYAEYIEAMKQTGRVK